MTSFKYRLYLINIFFCILIQMHTGAIRKLVNGLCVCIENNLFAKARELSYHTDAPTIQ